MNNRIHHLSRLAALLMLLMLTLSTQAANQCVQPPSDIIAWWPFDETSGTTAYDRVGNHPGAYVNSPIPASGKVDGGLKFNGSNYVGVVDNDVWAFGTKDFTVELWANFDVPGSGSIGHPGDIFIGNDEGPGSVRKWFFALGGGNLNFHINSPTIGAKFFPLAPFSPVVGQWYHLAITRNGNVYTLYIDGNPGASAVNSDVIPNPNAPLTIGQAEGLGYINGRLDEMTIYQRALTQEEVKSIVDAGLAGKCKGIIIDTKTLSSIKYGEFSSQQLKASYGVEPYSWHIVSGSLPSGLSLSLDGVLKGTPTEAGTFNITVDASDSSGASTTKDLSLDVLLTLPPPDVRIHKTGTVAVPGRSIDYFILAENIGTIKATSVNVTEYIDKSIFSLLSTTPQAVVDDSNAMIIWDINELLPGDSKIFSYQVDLNPSTPLSSTVIGGPACVGTDYAALSSCLIQAIGTSVVCTGCIFVCSSIPIACLNPTSPLTCPNTIVGCTSCLAGCGLGIAKVQECYTKASKDCDSHKQPARGAIDPNEKVVTSKKFINPDQLLVYPIHYENVGDIEARDVFVTDILDDTLDISTLNLLTPTGGTIDIPTRTVKWSLLNTNLQPGKTDNVLLSIRPKRGLPSGTEIRNKATIKFEVFDPMTTNEVVNVIDSTPPSCSMVALPEEAPNPDVSVSWNGSDEVGEIDSYAIFVSENGGGFKPFIEKTTTTSATFNGARDKTYQFICIARDTAGNTEIQEPIAESATRIATTPKPGDLNSDGAVTCADLAIVKASFGKRTGQVGFDPRADVNKDAIVDIRDLSFVSRLLLTGTKCS